MLQEYTEEDLSTEMQRGSLRGIYCLVSADEPSKQRIIIAELDCQNDSYIIFSDDYDFVLDAEERAKDNMYKTIIVDINYDFRVNTIRKKMQTFFKMQKKNRFVIFFMIPKQADPKVEKMISYCYSRIMIYLNRKNHDHVTLVAHPYCSLKKVKIKHLRIGRKVSVLVTTVDLQDILDDKAWMKFLKKETFHVIQLKNSS